MSSEDRPQMMSVQTLAAGLMQVKISQLEAEISRLRAKDQKIFDMAREIKRMEGCPEVRQTTGGKEKK